MRPFHGIYFSRLCTQMFVKLSTDKPCFIVPFFIALHRYFIFTNRFVATLCQASLLVPFPTLFAHFMFHLWVIIAMFQTISLLLYLL